MGRPAKTPSLLPEAPLVPTDAHERRLLMRYARVAGVDEAGRGPLAGPVVAASVVFPPGTRIPGIADSKTLTAAQRDALFDAITDAAVSIGVGWSHPDEIDAVNILQATFRAMRRALAECTPAPDSILVDGHLPIPDCPAHQVTLVRGDARSISVAAAGIVAKVTRDRYMREKHAEFPHYHFFTNVGYGTAQHLAALHEHGPCQLHRRSFRGVAPDEFIPDTHLPLFGDE